MGSEQSSRRDREERQRARRNDCREASSSAATARDVEVALDQQRKLYEQKMKELVKEQQKKLDEQRINVFVLKERQKFDAAMAATASTGQHPQTSTASTTNLERQHTPYSYSRNELQDTVKDSNLGTLYPNIGAYSTRSSGNTASVSPPTEHTRRQDFVFVNSHFKNDQKVQPAQSSSFTPSAPPSETSSTVSSTNFRSRSHSRQRGPDDDIKCPTCGKMFGDRIYQCNQGHSSCNLCKMRQVPCGQCRCQLTDRRNFDLEKYVMERRVKCPNFADGCRLHIKMAEMEIHEKKCPFKPLECPSLGFCNWAGKLSQLSNHFETMHPTHLQGEIDKEMFLSNIYDTSHTMHYIHIGPYNFLIHVKVSEVDRRIYMAIQLIGTKYSAAKWYYQIDIYKKNEPRRKFQYIDRCLSSSEPIQEIVQRTSCAVIPLEYAKTFICNDVLTYKFFIKKDEIKTNENVNNNTRYTGNGENGPRRNFKKSYAKKS